MHNTLFGNSCVLPWFLLGFQFRHFSWKLVTTTCKFSIAYKPSITNQTAPISKYTSQRSPRASVNTSFIHGPTASPRQLHPCLHASTIHIQHWSKSKKKLLFTSHLPLMSTQAPTTQYRPKVHCPLWLSNWALTSWSRLLDHILIAPSHHPGKSRLNH